MTAPLTVIPMPTTNEFIQDHVRLNQPVVIDGLDFDPNRWTPAALSERLGPLNALIYGDLFDLEDVQAVEDYLEDWFDVEGPISEEVPYIRWYNKLRDVDFAWGDEALGLMADTWQAPSCLPTDLLLPVTEKGAGTNPVMDPFPYRGLLIAARGARTRLHRDPFSSDAVVCQFHGTKVAALYRPERSCELTATGSSSSFGGFLDVRADNLMELSVEPDFYGTIEPGQMIYIPNGWLHDVLVTDDSASVTWNFIHHEGAAGFRNYLCGAPETDSEFEILRYFRQLAGCPEVSAVEMVA